MFIPGKPYISYKHLEAKTPEELELLMLEISVKATHPTSFSAPSFSGGKWHTWYLYDWSLDIKPKEKLNLQNNQGK